MVNAAKNLSIMLNNMLHALKTDSKGAIQKTAEAAGDLIGNKIADKGTKYFRDSCKWERSCKS